MPPYPRVIKKFVPLKGLKANSLWSSSAGKYVALGIHLFFGLPSFTVAGPCIWNSLPSRACNSFTKIVICSKRKTYPVGIDVRMLQTNWLDFTSFSLQVQLNAVCASNSNVVLYGWLRLAWVVCNVIDTTLGQKICLWLQLSHRSYKIYCFFQDSIDLSNDDSDYQDQDPGVGSGEVSAQDSPTTPSQEVSLKSTWRKSKGV